MRLSVVALVVLSLAGCASRPPTAQENKAAAISQAEDALEAGEVWQAFKQISRYRTGATKLTTADVAELKAIDPAFGTKIVARLEQEIGNAKQPSALDTTGKDVDVAREAGLISAAEADLLLKRIDQRAAAANRDGSVPFILTDDLHYMPGLSAADHKAIMLTRSIEKAVAETPPLLLTNAIMAEAKAAGAGSAAYSEVEAALPKMKLSRAAIEGSVQDVFPEFASVKLAGATVQMHLAVGDSDKLLGIDVSERVGQLSKAVKFVDRPSAETLNVTIEKLAYDEIQDTDRTQVVAIAYHQVDAMKAVFLMPQNASYLYDLTTGGARIEYAFNVSATMNGTPVSEKLLRDAVKYEYHACSNARVQNVFGGMEPANFTANAEMENFCRRSSSPKRVSALRSDVIDRLAKEIVRLQPIVDAEAALK